MIRRPPRSTRTDTLFPYTTLFRSYSLLNRDAEKDLIPAPAHYGAGFIPYFPLASGLLTGKYSGQDAQGRLKDNFLNLGNNFITERNLKIVAALDAFCRERGHTLLALAISRAEEHKPELQSLMRNAYAVFCLK